MYVDLHKNKGTIYFSLFSIKKNIYCLHSKHMCIHIYMCLCLCVFMCMYMCFVIYILKLLCIYCLLWFLSPFYCISHFKFYYKFH